MSDPQPPPGVSPPPGPARRARAPTITIDTSAVQSTPNRMSGENEHELEHLSDDGRSLNGDRTERPAGLHAQSTPTELRASNSFDSRDSRPTSPHNISSPTQWKSPHNFLAVPNTRSRGQSFDTDNSGETASTSDATYVNTQNGAGESAPKVFNEKQASAEHPILPDSEALIPDKGTEADFHRENNPFAFTPGQMGKMYNPKSLGAFHAVGGLAGLEKGLRSDRHTGLSVDEKTVDGAVTFEEATTVQTPSSDTTLEEPEMVKAQSSGYVGTGTYEERKRIFSDNRLPAKKQKTIFELMWLAYNDKVLIVLTVAAVIALAVGLYQSLGTPEGGLEWIEGVAIIVAIVVVVMVGALNDWQKEKQFAKLNAKKESRNVKVVRSGKTQEVSIHEIYAGDVLMIEPGDILPVDGVFISGHGVKCDESSATGESDIIKKSPSDEVYRTMESNENLKKMDPFMISGGKVTEGFGRMLVTATGVHSSHGKTMLSLQEGNEATPLQMKLNNLAEYIAKIGSAAALLLFIVLLIKFLAALPGNNDSPAEKGQQFITILITTVTIIVVAVPEGLPLAVTLALAYATKHKTGTLTQNVMTVVAGSIGTSNRFSSRSSNATEETKAVQDAVDDVPTTEFIGSLSKDIKDLWKESITINSTAFEADEAGKKIFVGSKTETALLDFARDYLGMEGVSVERSNAQVVQMIPFDSGRKCMGMAVKRKDGKGYRLIVKGASEIMLKHCNQILRDPTHGIDTTAMTGDNRQTLTGLIDAYASRSLRTIGFIYREFESWPPKGAKMQEDDPTQVVFEHVCRDMTFLGLVGIQDPLRAGVPEAVQDCIKAGVFPRMVTGDNILTAKAIATECGIYTPGGVAIEGPEFRKMTDAEQRQVIPKLQVLARSSPDDKRKLVKRLREMGETVAVTGDGTNDAPALKAADVGFSMNIAGTEVAKEASDIILMDDNFASIVLALMWGRAVNDAVRKFLQFQITVNITAVLLAFISSVSSSEEQSVLTAVQLLWINLIMDTMAALALATDPPTRSILNRKPDPKSAALISTTMWKMIIGQAIYQLTVTLVLYFAGGKILNMNSDPHTKEGRELQTLVFNTFTWMQIFNALNNRRLDNKFNIFEGISNNWFFIFIWFVMIAGQTLIIFVGGYEAFNAQKQTASQWGIALVLGALSLPMGVVIRLFPNEIAARMAPEFVKNYARRKRETPVVVSDEESPFEFNQALYDIKDELAFIKRYKGGRLNSLKFTLQHPKEIFTHSRSPSRSRASSSLPRTPNNEAVVEDEQRSGTSPAPPTPESKGRRRGRSRSNSAFAATAMAGIVAGSIAGGFSPVEKREGDTDSLRFAGHHRSKSDLSKEMRLGAHPETKPSDNVLTTDNPVEEAGNKPPSQSTETTPQFGFGPYGGEPVTKKDEPERGRSTETKDDGPST
ncbi:plasma membrane calcium [Vermiconidia calcicola]|uniref:Plasma membrane calcium n=1 Tax=Vermiconidia calcicola TaxID=1690605 RepID=A0ACC3MMK9_9PEZI|nr:plasma membrane calcium [Vermiconidia calcicola]